MIDVDNDSVLSSNDESDDVDNSLDERSSESEWSGVEDREC